MAASVALAVALSAAPGDVPARPPPEPTASETPAPSQADADAGRPRRTGVALAIGSAVMWGGTVALRLVPELLDDPGDFSDSCHDDEVAFGERWGCRIRYGEPQPRSVGLSWGLSYLTTVTAIGMMAGAGYELGLARRQRLPNPRAVRTSGITLMAVGLAGWLVPRIGFLASAKHFHATLNPTFYAGLGLASIGFAMVTYEGGDRERVHPWRPGHAWLTVGPSGLAVRGRF